MGLVIETWSITDEIPETPPNGASLALKSATDQDPLHLPLGLPDINITPPNGASIALKGDTK